MNGEVSDATMGGHKERPDGKVCLYVPHGPFDHAARTKKLLGPRNYVFSGKKYAVVMKILCVEDCEDWANLIRVEAQDRKKEENPAADHQAGLLSTPGIQNEDAEPKRDGDTDEDDDFRSDVCLFDC